MISIQNIAHKLQFSFPAGTSRGVLTEKDSVLFRLNGLSSKKYGEASFIPGLSADSMATVQQHFSELNIQTEEDLIKQIDTKRNPPSLQFALETLVQQKASNNFTKGLKGIPINGLIWMGNIDFMEEQIQQKINTGFKVIKIKIGTVGWEQEHKLLQQIRAKYTKENIEIRVDANGAFEFEEAQKVLDQLYKLGIHSIEQPIKKGQTKLMRKICANTPVPVALDEELIGIHNFDEKAALIKNIQPQYLILKPGLLGGFKSCGEWIKIAKQNNVGFWITSALESNIGLNAIAQWTYQLGVSMPQGLGTGGLFTNNIPSPLEIKGNKLYYNPEKNWDYSRLKW